MVKNKETGKSVKKDRSITATGIVIVIIFALLVSAYVRINKVITQRSLSRMEEGVNTVIEEVVRQIRPLSERIRLL